MPQHLVDSSPALAGGVRPAASAGVRARAVALVEATKPRSVLLLGFVGLASGVWALGALPPGAAPAVGPLGATPLVRMVLAVLAVTLGSMGANAMTGGIDHAMDGAMSRTRHRPCPTGRLTPTGSLLWGAFLVALATGITALTGHLWSTFWLVFGALDVVLLYNGWSKPRTPWSVVLGSPAGGAPVLVATSAVTGAVADPAALLLAGLVTVWTPIHVWSLAIRYVEDYRAAGVPMLPVAIGVKQAARCVAWTSLGLCVLAALLPAALGLSPLLTALVLALQVPIVVASLATTWKPTAGLSWLLFKLTSPYLALLFLVVLAAA